MDDKTDIDQEKPAVDPLAKEEPLLTSAHLRAYLDISKPTLIRLIQSGDIPAFKVGGDYRFKLSEVMKALKVKPKER